MLRRKAVKAGTSRAAAEARKAQFVEGMLIYNGNQTKAAIHAGFPEKSAHVRGAELVKDRKVIGMLEVRRAEQLAASKLTADEVLGDLASALRFNPKALYNEDGSLKPLHTLPDEVAANIEGVKEEDIVVGKGEQAQKIGRVVEIKYRRKTPVREQAMKHFGLYESDNRQRAVPTVLIGQLTVGLDFSKVRARAGLFPHEQEG